MMKYWIIILVILFPFYGFSQINNFDAILEKEQSILREKNYNSIADGFLFLGEQYDRLDEDKSKYYWKKYYDIVYKHKDSIRLGNYFYHLAYQYINRQNFEQAEKMAAISADFTEQLDLFTYLEVQQIRIRALHYLGKTKLAEKIGITLIKKNRFQQFPIQLAKIYFNLGLVTLSLSRDSGLNFLYQAIPYLIKNPENRVLLPVYHSIANFYTEKNKMDSAIKYAFLAYNLSKDSLLYDDVDRLLPAYNLQYLLKKVGKNTEGEQITRLMLINRFKAKVKSNAYPDISMRIAYLEFLRNKQKIRFVILVAFFVSGLLILSLLVFFYFKLKKKKNELSLNLQQNEILLRETNHRVKNNYQMMMSMLQNHNSKSTLSIEQFIEQNVAKIASMAKVHELFLQTTSEQVIDSDVFFQEILQSLEQSLSLKQKKIHIKFQTNQCVLKSSIIITLGLIINELVVNAVKYAFEGLGTGNILFTLHQTGDCYTMRYQDDGIGISTDKKDVVGAGMSIIFSLAKQLKGEAEIMQDSGTKVEIKFNA